MKYYAAEQMKKVQLYTLTWINIVIMLSEKNRSHKSRILFTKNKTKNYICFRVHM